MMAVENIQKTHELRTGDRMDQGLLCQANKKGTVHTKIVLQRKIDVAMDAVGRRERGTRDIEGIYAGLSTGQEPGCALSTWREKSSDSMRCPG